VPALLDAVIQTVQITYFVHCIDLRGPVGCPGVLPENMVFVIYH